VIQAIEKLLEEDTAGEPMGGLRWTRKTTEKVSGELTSAGIKVSPNTVARLLHDLGYALRVNHKKRAARARHPDRNRQFEHIAALRRSFQRRGLPIISIDTKKKELVGCFKNNGTAWTKRAREVNDHDFRSEATGFGIPYGIYDPTANRGHLFVGTSHDTPAFASDAVRLWLLFRQPWHGADAGRPSGAVRLMGACTDGRGWRLGRRSMSAMGGRWAVAVVWAAARRVGAEGGGRVSAPRESALELVARRRARARAARRPESPRCASCRPRGGSGRAAGPGPGGSADTR